MIEVRKYDIILLDFFLDKDDITALDIYHILDADIIVAFSSEDAKNDLIIQK